jgi:hypothetical protein
MGRKKIIFLLILIFIVLAVCFCFCFFFFKDKKIAMEIPAASLEEIENNIDSSNKKIKISLDINDLQNSLLLISKGWNNFYNNYKNNTPEKYKRTRDFDKKIWEINNISAKAYELSLEGKNDEAKAEADKAREMYLQIKKENNILDISNELYSFYVQASLVSIAENKEEIAPLLPELKIQFAGIKEKKQDKNYSSAIEAIEKLIIKLDRQLDGPELWEAQKDILLLAKKLFLDN